MKVSGAEFMEWYDNHFPEGYYHESDEALDDDGRYFEMHGDNGEWLLDPVALYDTDDLGYLAKDRGGHEDDLSIESQIRAFRKARDFDFITVRVPKVRVTEVRQLLKDAKCRVM
jgi:hypothetical protein